MFSSKLKRHQRKLKIEVNLISFIQGFLFKQSYRNIVNHNIQYVSISRLWYGSHNNRQGYNILVCIVKYSWLHTHNIFLANKPHTHTHTHTHSLSLTLTGKLPQKHFFLHILVHRYYKRFSPTFYPFPAYAHPLYLSTCFESISSSISLSLSPFLRLGCSTAAREEDGRPSPFIQISSSIFLPSFFGN